MWFFMGNQSRIVLSKLCPNQQFHYRHLRQFFKPGSHKKLTIIPRKQPNFPDLINPTIFTIGFCGLSLSGGLIWQYENMRYAERQKENPFTKFFRNMPTHSPPGDYKEKHTLLEVLEYHWKNLDEPQKIIYSIIGINAVVFLLWQIPTLTPMMYKYFACNPAKVNKCLPMLLCAFSHSGPFHLAFNMIALSSFGPPLIETLGKEQFLSFYAACAVFSSFTSSIFKVIIGTPWPSLGASGALFGLVGIYGTLYPENRLAIIFAPFIQFTAEQGIIGLALFDTLGIFLRWANLDHAAHLGGLLFGIWWIKEGRKLMKPIVQWWEDNRKQILGDK